MKATAVLLLSLLTASFVSTNIHSNDGIFVYITREEYDQLASEYSSENTKTRMWGYYLFTRDNPDEPQSLATNDSKALRNSYFSSKRPTRFIIHGYKGSYMSEVNKLLRPAFLDTGDYNIISVNYSTESFYPNSALAVPDLGKHVASFIDFLHREAGMSFETLLVAAHSLGAEVAAFAGKNVREGRIQQIIALDPGMPLFWYDYPPGRLNKHDAVYVESIQTCGGRYGFLRPIGKATFYPNGGIIQPNCNGSDLCSHRRSYIYYEEVIRLNDFDSIRCDNYLEVLEHACGHTYSGIKMGAPTNIDNAEGIFYVPVNGEPPFGRDPRVMI